MWKNDTIIKIYVEEKEIIGWRKETIKDNLKQRRPSCQEKATYEKRY